MSILFVTDIGEEGPPSAASTPIVLTDTEEVVVSLPGVLLIQQTLNLSLT